MFYSALSIKITRFVSGCYFQSKQAFKTLFKTEFINLNKRLKSILTWKQTAHFKNNKQLYRREHKGNEARNNAFPNNAIEVSASQLNSYFRRWCSHWLCWKNQTNRLNIPTVGNSIMANLFTPLLSLSLSHNPLQRLFIHYSL